MSIHIAKLFQRTYVSMLNGTFQSIFQHVTYVTTHTYLIIITYSFTVPKWQLMWEIFAKGIYFSDYDLHMQQFEHFV